MSKSPLSPGFVLKKLMDEYQTNPNRLSKEIGLTQTAVRLITIDKAKISVPAALRLAKYFGTTPEYWISLQNKYDLVEASKDKVLDKIVKGIKKAEEVKKAAPAKKEAPAKKAASAKKADPAKKAASAKKAAAKAAPSKKPAAKEAAPKANASSAPKKGGRPPKEAKPAATGTPQKRGRKPRAKPAPVQEKPFVPDVVLIKKQDTAPAIPDVSDPVSSEE